MPWPLEVSITMDSTVVRKRIQAIFDAMANMPMNRRQNIESIIRRGLRDNFDRLSNGWPIQLASGAQLFWDQRRHPITWKIRRELGLDPILPLLHLTGKLEHGLFEGTSSAVGGIRSSARVFRYSPGADIAPLIRVHQKGLEPLSDDAATAARAAKIGRVVPRPMLIWSKSMADSVKMEWVRYGKELSG